MGPFRSTLISKRVTRRQSATKLAGDEPRFCGSNRKKNKFNGNWYCEVVQRCEGLRFHYSGRRGCGRLLSSHRNSRKRLPHFGGRPKGGVRNHQRSEGLAGCERPTDRVELASLILPGPSLAQGWASCFLTEQSRARQKSASAQQPRGRSESCLSSRLWWSCGKLVRSAFRCASMWRQREGLTLRPLLAFRELDQPLQRRRM